MLQCSFCTRHAEEVCHLASDWLVWSSSRPRWAVLQPLICSQRFFKPSFLSLCFSPGLGGQFLLHILLQRLLSHPPSRSTCRTASSVVLSPAEFPPGLTCVCSASVHLVATITSSLPVVNVQAKVSRQVGSSSNLPLNGLLVFCMFCSYI